MCAHWQRQPRPPLALKSLQRCELGFGVTLAEAAPRASRGVSGWMPGMGMLQPASSSPRPGTSSVIIPLFLPRSQLNITLLLLFLGVKVPVILALLCGAMWLRKRHRSCSPWDNLQQSEKSSSTAAPGSPDPQQPDPPAAQQHPSGPLPYTLPGLNHWRCSASGSSLSAKPQPLLLPFRLHKGRVGVRRSHVC